MTNVGFSLWGQQQKGHVGIAGLGEGLEGLGVSPCRNGGIAKLGAHAGMLLEGLLGMGCNTIVLGLHYV